MKTVFPVIFLFVTLPFFSKTTAGDTTIQGILYRNHSSFFDEKKKKKARIPRFNYTDPETYFNKLSR